MSKYGEEVKQRKMEDDADVRFIIRNFNLEHPSKERLELILKNSVEYQKRETRKGFVGGRGNRNLIKAIELLISNPEMICNNP